MKQKKHTLTKPEGVIFSFREREHEKREKGPFWYLAAFSLLIFLVLYGFFTGAWTFSLALLVFAGVYGLFHNAMPETREIILTKSGITIGSLTFPYDQLQSFAIHSDIFSRLHLILIPKKRFTADKVISVTETEAANLRHHLSQFLEEKIQYSQKFSDVLVELFNL